MGIVRVNFLILFALTNFLVIANATDALEARELSDFKFSNGHEFCEKLKFFRKPCVFISGPLILPPVNSTSSEKTVLNNTKICNITQLGSTHETLLWASQFNVFMSYSSNRWDNMTLEIGSLELGGVKYENASVLLNTVEFGFNQQLRVNSTRCHVLNRSLTVTNRGKAVLNNKTDITSYVDRRAVPFINQQLNSWRFLNEHFVVCAPEAKASILSQLLQFSSKNNSGKAAAGVVTGNIFLVLSLFGLPVFWLISSPS